MSRRQTTPNASSLELLLDTICNTFGGVLFISILVVVLLNVTGESVRSTPPDAKAQAELVEVKQQLDDAQDRLRTLKNALAGRKRIASELINQESLQLANQLKQKTNQLAALVEKKNLATSRIAAFQLDVNQIARQLQQKNQLQAQLAQLERELDQEVAGRTQTARLPQVKQTNKSQKPFFLKNGRFVAIDGRESVRSIEGGTIFFDPKPGAGVEVDPDGSTDQRIAAKLSQYDKDRHYLSIFVWPDSFAHFPAVKQVMVQLQFDYEAVPMPQGQRVRSGRSRQSLVQ